MNSSDYKSATRFSNPRVAGSIPAAPTSQRKPVQSQQDTALPQLHQSDEGRIYLRSALQHTLAKVEAGTEPLDRKKWKDYERLRQLVRMYRQTGRIAIGSGRFVQRYALRFCFSLCLAGALVLAFTPTNEHYRVLRKYNAYDFQLQKVVYGHAQRPMVWHFCHDFKPLFQTGFTLTSLKWIDNPDCAEIAPIPDAYRIERRDGEPTIPSNCVNPADADSFCKGDPNFN